MSRFFSPSVPVDSEVKPPREQEENPKDSILSSGQLRLVPQELTIRQVLLQRIRETSPLNGMKTVITRPVLEAVARELLREHNLSDDYTGWTMVALASHYWRPFVTQVPYNRRILLIPHCLHDSRYCQGSYDALGLHCQRCGHCPIASLLDQAEKLGYLVLVAEGTPIVMQWIISGKVDAILGVGCLKSLERAFDKLLWAGIPAMAVPLLAGTCKDTETDIDEVVQMIETPWLPGEHSGPQGTWLPLLRATAALFQPDEFQRLLRLDQPAQTGSSSKSNPEKTASEKTKTEKTEHSPEETDDPFQFVEEVGRDFMTAGGKFYRPFITLATYDILTSSRPANREDRSGDFSDALDFPDAVKRVALAMEAFHKASLVHDDIEDGDLFRYGNPTVHRRCGIPAAINIGDWLLGLGYRLIGTESGISADVSADLLRKMSSAHLLLCRGQGAELFQKERRHSVPTPLDVLRVYSLKTAPAFEAALYTGIRLALSSSETEAVAELVTRFSRFIGIGFQIRNDLSDWRESVVNKIDRGADFFAGRPTVLRAFAAEVLGEKENELLNRLALDSSQYSEAGRKELLAEVEDLYRRAGSFEKAKLLIEKYSQKAKSVIDAFPASLQDFLTQLTDTVLR